MNATTLSGKTIELNLLLTMMLDYYANSARPTAHEDTAYPAMVAFVLPTGHYVN